MLALLYSELKTAICTTTSSSWSSRAHKTACSLGVNASIISCSTMVRNLFTACKVDEVLKSSEKNSNLPTLTPWWRLFLNRQLPTQHATWIEYGFLSFGDSFLSQRSADDTRQASTTLDSRQNFQLRTLWDHAPWTPFSKRLSKFRLP